jgi:hypothetical protein
MPLQLGDFRIPTLGDTISGGEHILGDLIDDVIHATTGATVDLTPSEGVSKATLTGPKGSGSVQLDTKLASHDEVERLKREVKAQLVEQAKELAKLKIQLRQNQPARMPAWSGPAWNYNNANANQQSMNPMMLLFLLGEQGAGVNLASNPLALFALMQMMQSSPIASVGGQPVNIDMTTIALLSSMFGLLKPPSTAVQQTTAPGGH